MLIIRKSILIFLFFVLGSLLFGIDYYIHPQKGNDNSKGLSEGSSWKSFKPLNEIELKAGDHIKILASGDFHSSLKPIGKGSAENPVIIEFTKGVYSFFPTQLYCEKYQISNTNDAPNSPKKAAIILKNCQHFTIEGNDSLLFMRGKMIETVIDQSENINIEGLNYDYFRPTVSEFSVESINRDRALISVNSDSAYEIRNKKIHWVGEGWEMKAGGYFQELNPSTNRVSRCGKIFSNLIQVKEIKPFELELTFLCKPKIKVGHTYQNRDPFRDYSAFFISRSKNISFNQVNIHFMHGMGIVSQFTQNMDFNQVIFKPRKESKRTCSGWADLLHFSGCGGRINITNTLFSGANDDAINVHGTHLRVANSSGNQLQAQFMHRQTFGFQPFIEGDKIALIDSATLLPYFTTEVKTVKKIDDKNWSITTLDKLPQTDSLDVIENISWAADVNISNCQVERIPTRGFLISTRGKVVITGNRFYRTNMSAISVADDARSWFESGIVTDLEINGNQFIGCNSPIINIHPENIKSDKNRWVHSNIRIINNTFTEITNKTTLFFFKSSDQIVVKANKVDKKGINFRNLSQIINCGNIVFNENSYF